MALRLRLYTVSARQPTFISEGFANYARRLREGIALELVILRPADSGLPTSLRQSREAALLAAHLRPDEVLIALDERGKSLTSTALAAQLEQWELDARPVSLAIGGDDGHDESTLRRAAWTWSLSSLTLPHGLVRVIVAEQIYRAMTIRRGHPYHRD